MLDIYTAVQIRGQSAVHPATRALVNGGRTANVGRAPRLALAIACALGSFAVNGVYRVDGGSASPPSGSASTALGPRPPPLPFLDFDGSLAVSETSSSVALRCGAPRPANISRCSRAKSLRVVSSAPWATASSTRSRCRLALSSSIRRSVLAR